MDKYDGKDIYCYENTNVLINKLDIRDEKELTVKERKLTTLNTIKIYNDFNIEKIKFNLEFYKHIHKTLFFEIYPFAGKYRNIVLIKGATRFCEPQYIESYLKNIFKELKNELFFENVSKELLVERIAYYYSELNAVHPYREGNGRTNRIFIDLLSKDVIIT